MKIRKWKIAALLATSGVLLQLGGCAAVIFQIVAQQVFTSALSGLLDGLLPETGGTTDTTTTP